MGTAGGCFSNRKMNSEICSNVGTLLTTIAQNESDTNESRNTTRCQSCNVWINLDGSYVDNPVVSGRTVIITFPKVIIPVTLVALFFLGSWFNLTKV